MNAQINRQTHV